MIKQHIYSRNFSLLNKNLMKKIEITYNITQNNKLNILGICLADSLWFKSNTVSNCIDVLNLMVNNLQRIFF